MKYLSQIYKNKIYVKPHPNCDIPEGLIVILIHQITGKERFITTDINKNQRVYELPKLKEGFKIIGSFVKDGRKDTR